MKTNTKIKAFTLSELIVVLILSSIIVGLAFSVLTLVQRHMHGIQENLSTNTTLKKLEQSLWIDFNRFSKISYSNTNNELVLASEIDSTSYKFLTQYVVKETDTFKVAIKSKTFFFDAKTIESGAVDALKLKTTKAFRSQELFIFMENDANAYMN